MMLDADCNLVKFVFFEVFFGAFLFLCNIPLSILFYIILGVFFGVACELTDFDLILHKIQN